MLCLWISNTKCRASYPWNKMTPRNNHSKPKSPTKNERSCLFPSLSHLLVYSWSSSPSPSESGPSPTWVILPFLVCPSPRTGIRMPCRANALLKSVESNMPGNFFALETWKTSERTVARHFDEPLWSETFPRRCSPVSDVLLIVRPDFSSDRYFARLKKLNFSLNFPSVRTERSWRMNQMPISFLSSFNRKAEAVRLPIRFLVNCPPWAGCTG